MNAYDRLVSSIGNTPLTKLRTGSSSTDNLRVFAKCEFLNPTGSSKARPARQMILDALAKETSVHGKRFLDSGSGGTAEAEAMVAARLKCGLDVVMSAATPASKIAAVTAYGANIIFSEPAGGSEGAHRKAAELARSQPGYIYLNQYANDSNWRAHTQTAEEIFEQTEGRITHVYVGLGTGGTATGIGRGLRAKVPGVKIIGVMPEGPEHKLYGLKYITRDNKPPILDMSLIDHIVRIPDEEAMDGMTVLARQEGLYVGPSSGAVFAAWQRERRLVEEGVIALLMHDDARKYPGLIGRSLQNVA